MRGWVGAWVLGGGGWGGVVFWLRPPSFDSRAHITQQHHHYSTRPGMQRVVLLALLGLALSQQGGAVGNDKSGPTSKQPSRRIPGGGRKPAMHRTDPDHSNGPAGEDVSPPVEVDPVQPPAEADPPSGSTECSRGGRLMNECDQYGHPPPCRYKPVLRGGYPGRYPPDMPPLPPSIRGTCAETLFVTYKMWKLPIWQRYYQDYYRHLASSSSSTLLTTSGYNASTSSPSSSAVGSQPTLGCTAAAAALAPPHRTLGHGNDGGSSDEGTPPPKKQKAKAHPRPAPTP